MKTTSPISNLKSAIAARFRFPAFRFPLLGSLLSAFLISAFPLCAQLLYVNTTTNQTISGVAIVGDTLSNAFEKLNFDVAYLSTNNPATNTPVAGQVLSATDTTGTNRAWITPASGGGLAYITNSLNTTAAYISNSFTLFPIRAVDACFLCASADSSLGWRPGECIPLLAINQASDASAFGVQGYEPGTMFSSLVVTWSTNCLWVYNAANYQLKNSSDWMLPNHPPAPGSGNPSNITNFVLVLKLSSQ
jgi:hypothetical protein